MSYGNEPTIPADVDGAVGQAWKIPYEWKPGDPKDSQAGVVSWLVHAPGGHPYWWWYCVAAIHLRPMEGVKEAHLQFPGASHEILFISLNPEKPLPSLDDWRDMAILTPLDLAHQVILKDDEEAEQLTRDIVAHICDGHSPDSDFRDYWERCINATAEHIRLGGHPA